MYRRLSIEFVLLFARKNPINESQSTMVTTTLSFADLADQELERRIVATLVARNFPGLRRLRVSVDRGEVTIAGRVRSFYEKQLAQHVARRVAGVIRLVDAIQVVDPPRPSLGSRWSLSPEVSAVLTQRRFSVTGGEIPS